MASFGSQLSKDVVEQKTPVKAFPRQKSEFLELKRVTREFCLC